jgi:hypothetical protein
MRSSVARVCAVAVAQRHSVMPTKTLKPLPQPLRYLQPFVNKLAKLAAKLGPEWNREHDIDAGPLDAELRKRVRGLDRRSAEARLAEDRDFLGTWLKTTGGPHHPAYWVLGYLSSRGLANFLRRPPPKPKPKPKQPRRSAILFEAPDGWSVKPGTWRLDVKTKGIVGLIEGMDEAEYDDSLRLLRHIQPARRPREAQKVTVTTTNIRRGGCCGKKYVVKPGPKLAPSKLVRYMLRVPGGGVTIVLDGTGKADFDESPLESKLHTLRVRRRA